MANLVLGVIGYAITGTPIGFTIGSTLGSLLFPPDGQNITQEGARLSDLRVTSSALGVAIPRVYGSARLAGNMIWSQPILETRSESTQEAGGKGGGGSVTTITYTYSQTFAIALCEGPISGITRIWANGELIYNTSDSADAATLSASAAFAAQYMTVYLGDEAQTPNSTIQADVGAANCPAYRGLAYVVFSNLPLADYSNRTPNLEFEVVSGEASTGVIEWQGFAAPADNDWNAVAYGAGKFVAVGWKSGAQNFMYSSDGMSWALGVAPTTDEYGPVYANTPRLGGVAYGNGVWVATQATGGYNDLFVISTDGITWQGVPNYSGTAEPYTPLNNYPDYYGYECVKFFNGIFVAGTTGKAQSNFIGLATSTDGTHWTGRTVPTSVGVKGVHYGGGTWVAVGTWGNDSKILYSTDNAVTWTLAHTVTNSYLSDVAYGDGLFVTVSNLNLGGGDRILTSPDGITWTARTDPLNRNWQRVTYGDGLFVAICNGNISTSCITSPDGITWTVTDVLSDWNGLYGITYARGRFVAVDEAASTTLMALRRISYGAEHLGSIVVDVCADAGMLTADLDVVDLTDEVSGYLIASRGTARAALESLQRAYFFDCVESAGMLKFVKRGGAVAAHIAEADLAAHVSGAALPDNLQMTVAQETELPHEVSVSYLEAESDYAVAVQYARRQVGNAVQQVTINLPIVLSASRARQIAEALLWDAWMGRVNFATTTSRKYSHLEPTDVIQIDKGSVTHTARIVAKDEAGGVVSLKLVRADMSQALGATGTGLSVFTQDPYTAPRSAGNQTVTAVPDTVAHLLDLPPLRDADDAAGFYLAACAADTPTAWRGMALYRSVDGGATWGAYSAIAAPAAIGTATALGDFAGGNIFDELNTVTVTLYAGGTLAGVTKTQVLAGANAALVGDELIQFRDATLVAANTYTLTGLLRGRAGTDWAMATHAEGDRFVVLAADTLRRVADASGDIGLERLFRAPSAGTLLADAANFAFTDQGASLRPLAPVHLGGGRDAAGNLTLHWTRRARLGTAWRDNVDVALDEATEAYAVEIYDNAFAALKRTLNVTAATAAYSAADQTSDFGSPPASIGVRIYQLSARVGRGTAASAVL